MRRRVIVTPERTGLVEARDDLSITTRWEALKGLLTWQRVRGVGELQILTRASYVTLAIVPLLVGIWPQVRVLISGHNLVLEHSIEELSKVGNALSEHAAAMRVALERATTEIVGAGDEAARTADESMGALANHAHVLAGVVNRELASLRQQATLSPWLPSSLALGWFAALTVALGHLLYETQAPEVVRRSTRDDYIRQQRQAYREHQSVDAFGSARKNVIATHSRRIKLDAARWKRFLDIRDGYIKAPRPDSVLQYMRDLNDDKAAYSTFSSGLTLAIAEAAASYLSGMRELQKAREGENGAAYNASRAEVTLAGSIDADEAGDAVERARVELNQARFLRADAEAKWEELKRQIQHLREALEFTHPYERHEWQFAAENAGRRAGGATRNDASIHQMVRELFDSELLGPASELEACVNVVGEAAQLEYDAALSTQTLAMLAALTMYYTGFGIILLLVVKQARAVGSAAGWL